MKLNELKTPSSPIKNDYFETHFAGLDLPLQTSECRHMSLNSQPSLCIKLDNWSVACEI